jgi:hypothetical protein
MAARTAEVQKIEQGLTHIEAWIEKMISDDAMPVQQGGKFTSSEDLYQNFHGWEEEHSQYITSYKAFCNLFRRMSRQKMLPFREHRTMIARGYDYTGVGTNPSPARGLQAALRSRPR